MINFTLPLPVSLNALYKIGNRKFYKAHEAIEWAREAETMLYQSKIHKKILEGDLYVGIEMFVKRDRDIDSGLKLLLDFMQERFYINDSQIKHLNVKKYEDKKNPRVEICIEKL